MMFSHQPTLRVQLAAESTWFVGIVKLKETSNSSLHGSPGSIFTHILLQTRQQYHFIHIFPLSGNPLVFRVILKIFLGNLNAVSCLHYFTEMFFHSEFTLLLTSQDWC